MHTATDGDKARHSSRLQVKQENSEWPEVLQTSGEKSSTMKSKLAPEDSVEYEQPR